ncbi:MAG: glycosyltransferase family 39 protein [Elusimicrobia bacterium]|nr:glycosyltransferase family 39 protein [Elusimicrobiota bacterium]
MIQLKNKWLWAICSEALVLRLFFFSIVAIHPERVMYGDAPEYHHLAVNLLNGLGLCGNDEPPFEPTKTRQCLYPIFIATTYFFFGQHPVIVALWQNLMDTLSVIIIFSIGCLLAGIPTGLLSAALYAFNPVSIIHNQFLLTETTFVFVLLLGLWGLVYSIQRRSLLCLFLGTIAWGLAMHVRATGMLLPIILVVFAAASQWGYKLKRIIFVCCTTILLFFLVLTPWYYRNYLLFNKFFFSDNYNLALLCGHLVPSLAHATHRTPDETLEDVLQKISLKHPGILLIQSKKNLQLSTKLLKQLPRNWQTQNNFPNLVVQETFHQLLKYPHVYIFDMAISNIRMLLFPGTERSQHIVILLGIKEIPIRPLRDEIKQLLSQKKIVRVVVRSWKERVSHLSITGQILWYWIFLFEGALFVMAIFGLYSCFHYEQLYSLRLFSIIFLITALYFSLVGGNMIDVRYRFPADPFYSLLSGFFLNYFLIKNMREIE